MIVVFPAPEPRPDDLVHRPVLIGIDLLAEQSDPQTGFVDDDSVVRRSSTREDAQQRRLPFAVATQQAYPLTTLNMQRGVFHECTPPESYTEVLGADESHLRKTEDGMRWSGPAAQQAGRSHETGRA
jgi:hypothetical protein